MTIDKEARNSIKEAIKSLVGRKISLTRERREYKLETRGSVNESTRLAFFENIDYDRATHKHDIRHGLLLYGYIRGRDYKQLEPKVREDNDPSASDICLFGDKHGELALRQTDLSSWLAGGASPHKRKRPQDTEEAA